MLDFVRFLKIEGYTISVYSGDDEIQITNRPKDFMSIYYENDWYRLDPIVNLSLRMWCSGEPGFLWSEQLAKTSLTPAGRKIMDAASEAGIVDGFNIYAPGGVCHTTLVMHDSDQKKIENIWFRYGKDIAFLALAINQKYAQWIGQRAGLFDAMNSLGEGEFEAMRLLSEGMTLEEISEQLHISIPGVRNRLTNSTRKLGAKGRTNAVAIFSALQAAGVYVR